MDINAFAAAKSYADKHALKVYSSLDDAYNDKAFDMPFYYDGPTTVASSKTIWCRCRKGDIVRWAQGGLGNGSQGYGFVPEHARFRLSVNNYNLTVYPVSTSQETSNYSFAWWFPLNVTAIGHLVDVTAWVQPASPRNSADSKFHTTFKITSSNTISSWSEYISTGASLEKDGNRNEVMRGRFLCTKEMFNAGNRCAIWLISKEGISSSTGMNFNFGADFEWYPFRDESSNN